MRNPWLCGILFWRIGRSEGGGWVVGGEDEGEDESGGNEVMEMDFVESKGRRELGYS